MIWRDVESSIFVADLYLCVFTSFLFCLDRRKRKLIRLSFYENQAAEKTLYKIGNVSPNYALD